MKVNNVQNIKCFVFLMNICFLWIGAQLPQEIFISYGRILTLFYYFLIIYLLFGILFYSRYYWYSRDYKP